MKIPGIIDNKQFLQLAQGKESVREKPQAKYSAVPVKDGHDAFDSKHEAGKIKELRLLESAGVITDLQTDKRALVFSLDINEIHICRYVADAKFTVARDFELSGLSGVYRLRAGESVVYDAKSPPTRKNPVYKLKRNMMFAIHGIKILEG